MSELCIKCGKRGDKKCGRCRRVTYCSAQCQTDHWKAGHKGECKLLSDTSTSAYIAPAATAASPAATASAAAAKSAPASSSVSTPSTPPSTWQANERPRPPVEDFLFPPKRVQQMMSFQSREHELIGSTLTNVGNSCFVNAVMQCLTYTRPLTTAFLMHDEHDKACKRGERGDYCLWCILQQHVREALDPKGYVQITPRELLLNLPRIGQFRLGVQEDAHEFFLAVLSELQNAILSTMPKKPHPSLEDTTLLYQVFGGSMQSQVRCKQCGSVSCRYEPFLDLNLELSSGNSIEEALSSYTSIEELGKDVGWKCEKCNQVAAAQKQLTIYDCPNILSIQLKRFDLLQGGVKSHKSVVFREDLDLRRVVSFNRQHQDTSYELYAIVVHYGQTMHVGHYVAFVKIGNKWHLFDDAKMQEVNPAVVLQQSAYLLFYRKLYVLTPEEIDRRRREEAEKERQQKAAAAPKKKKALKHSTGELLPPPPHRIFYHLSADNAMSAFTVRVDLPSGFLPDKANLTVSESGSLALSTPQCPSLSLSLPMPLSVSRASARFYTKDSVLAVELPVESEAERGEREKREATASAGAAAPPAAIVTSEKSAKSEESVQKKKAPLSSSSTDVEIPDPTGHPIAIAVHDGPAQLNIDPENELEIARPSSPAPPSPQHADSTISGNGGGGVGAGDEGAKGGARKTTTAPSAENKEKATYHKLYQDLRNGPSAATSAAAPSEAKQKKAGRNDPCPCGSGKKYKNCHG